MSGIKFNELPFSDRPDLTPYLIHFTKNTQTEDEYSAYDNLVNILKTGEIWGSSKGKGFIKGNSPATCFMDVPFSSLKYILTDENSNPNRPRYEPYGIFITKKSAYGSGIRPVIYLSNEELKAFNIPQSEQWRVVRLEVSGNEWISWIHEREWRCKGNFKLPRGRGRNGVGVLVKNYADVRKLQKVIDTDPEDFPIDINSIIPLEVICQGLYI